MRLSVVIPARNEAASIETTLWALRKVLTESQIDAEIVVVDDGSTDGTGEIVEQVAKIDSRVRLLVNKSRHGYGYAVRRGLDAFLGDAVVISMADGSDDPQDVVFYYQALQERDCAFGTRWSKGGKAVNYPPFKRICNRLANRLIGLLFLTTYSDMTNGFKGFRRCAIEGCKPFHAGHFNFTIELPLKAITRGYSWLVVPTRHCNRTGKKTHLCLGEQAPRYLYTLLTIWLEKLLVRADYYRRDAT